MDKQSAKQALIRNRPWVPEEPEQAEANRDANTDPDLRGFREQSERFNSAIHAELSDIPIPPGLRDQILGRGKIVQIPFWRQPAILSALAASLLILAGGLFYWTRPREDLSIAGFRNRMTGFALREYRMDVVTNNLAAISSFLTKSGGPADFKLPAPLSRTPLKGAAHLTWQNQPVSMVCFDWKGTETLYVFVLSGPLGLAASPTAPEFKAVKNLSTASWTTNGMTFLLAGKVPEATLADLVKS